MKFLFSSYNHSYDNRIFKTALKVNILDNAVKYCVEYYSGFAYNIRVNS